MGFSPNEKKILTKLKSKIDHRNEMTKSELIRYCIRWVGQRLDQDILWVEHIRLEKIWTKGEIALLGKKPDAIVAEMTGRNLQAIRDKRYHMKIPRFKLPPGKLPKGSGGQCPRADWGYEALLSGINFNDPPDVDQPASSSLEDADPSEHA